MNNILFSVVALLTAICLIIMHNEMEQMKSDLDKRNRDIETKIYLIQEDLQPLLSEKNRLDTVVDKVNELASFCRGF